MAASATDSSSIRSSTRSLSLPPLKSSAMRCQEGGATVVRVVDRFDPDQLHAAQDEGEDVGGDLDATGEAGEGDDAAVLELAQDRGGGRAADGVDGGGEAFALERAAALGGEFFAVDDLGGPEVAQEVVGAGLAGAGGDGVAARGEHRDGGRADAAGGARDDDRAGVGPDPGALDHVDRDGGGEAGGAEGHRFFAAHAVGGGA